MDDKKYLALRNYIHFQCIMQYMQRTIMLIVLSWNMKKGTEAFKMIILRLSDSNCVRMPEYILSFKVKTVWQEDGFWNKI